MSALVVGVAARGLQQPDRGRGHRDRVVLGGQRLDHRGHPVAGLLGGQLLEQRAAGPLQPGRPQVGRGGHRGDLDRLPGEPLDRAQRVHLRRRHQGDGHPFASGPADPADAVHVGLRRLRHVVVDHVREQVDVQPAGGHVGGHQQLGAAAAQPLHHAGAVFLVHAAVQRLGAQPAPGQRLGDRVDVEPGAAEHDGRGRPLGLQHPAQRGGGVGARHQVGGLAHLRRLALDHDLAPDPHGHRLAQVLLRQRLDAARDGRGEQHDLPGVRGGVQQGLDVLDEAHVEHLVGLVEHDGLERVEAQRTPVHQVDGPAGGGHHDVDAVLQRLPLRADRRPAVDGDDAGPQPGAVAGDRLGHLQRELAGRREDQAERRVAAAAVRAQLGQPLQHGQREGGRLAGAGGGLTEQVTALHQRRDGLGLDRAGFGVAELVHHGQQLRPERKVVEGGQVEQELVRSQIRSLVAASGNTVGVPRRARGPPARVLPGRCGLWWSERTTSST